MLRTPNRMQVLIMPIRHQPPVGETWLPSAFLPSAEIPSGTRLVPIETVDRTFLFLCAYFLFSYPTHQQEFLWLFFDAFCISDRFDSLMTWLCGAFSGSTSACWAVAKHMRASLKRLGYTAGQSLLNISFFFPSVDEWIPWPCSLVAHFHNSCCSLSI